MHVSHNTHVKSLIHVISEAQVDSFMFYVRVALENQNVAWDHGAPEPTLTALHRLTTFSRYELIKLFQEPCTSDQETYKMLISLRLNS